MSIVISNIRKRLSDLKKLRRQNLTTQNADEHYDRDVTALLRANEALMKTCCQLNIQLHEAKGKQPREFTVYWNNFDLAVERLLTNQLAQKVDA